MTDVACTSESLQSIEIFPVYVALMVKDFAEVEAGALLTGAGFFVVQPAGHFGAAALTTLLPVPL